MSTDQDRLPSKPLRNWLLAWHIHTGDPPEVIARGFDLPLGLVVELVRGRPALMIDVEEALQACHQLRLAPGSLWSSFADIQLDWPHDVDGATSEIPNSLLQSLGGFS